MVKWMLQNQITLNVEEMRRGNALIALKYVHRCLVVENRQSNQCGMAGTARMDFRRPKTSGSTDAKYQSFIRHYIGFPTQRQPME
jgi:hypothetical protein